MTKGWKNENAFKAGYLTLLENAMQTAIPGTNIRGNPHINSKIRVWKKIYSSLVTLLSKSGVGWNDTENTINATDKTWESIVKHDPSFKQCIINSGCISMIGLKSSEMIELLESIQRILRMRYNKFLNVVKNFPTNSALTRLVHLSPFDGADDSISETHIPMSKKIVGTSSKSKKKKHTREHDESIVEAINNLTHIMKDTMSQLIKEISTDDKILDVQDTVLDALQGLTNLSEDEQVAEAKLLFNNHNDLAIFKRLGERGRICLVKRLLCGD